MDLRRFEVDGVPVFGVALDGPAYAGLTFRVGVVDEPPARRGLTHLVEHLAIAGLPRRPEHQFNGVTDTTHTSFYAVGNDVEVGQFLNDVCRSLQALPGDRFEGERRILSTEAMSSAYRSVAATLLALRYGMQGWGALELGEVGLPAITFDEVEVWSGTWFTAGNAAAWVVASEPEAVVRSLPLAAGLARPLDVQAPVLERLPAWFHADVSGPGLGLVGQRSVALRWAADIVGSRASEQLRHRDAVVYEVVSTYEPMTASTCHVHVGADALEEHRNQVLPGLGDAFAQIRMDGPTDDELERSHRGLRDERAHASALDRALGWAGFAAGRYVEGAEPDTPEELSHLEDAVDGPAIQQALDAVWPSALAVVPSGCEPPRTGFQQVPDWSTPVDGTHLKGVPRFRTRSAPNQTIAIGTGSLVLIADHNRHVVIEADRCPLVLAEGDGSRAVYGSDGFRVVVRPWLWDDDKTLVRTIDGFTDPASYVPIGPGSGPPEEVAKPARWWRRTRSR